MPVVYEGGVLHYIKMDGTEDIVRPSVEADPEEPPEDKPARVRRSNSKDAPSTRSTASPSSSSTEPFSTTGISQGIPYRTPSSSHNAAGRGKSASNTGGISISAVLNSSPECTSVAMFADPPDSPLNSHNTSGSVLPATSMGTIVTDRPAHLHDHHGLQHHQEQRQGYHRHHHHHHHVHAAHHSHGAHHTHSTHSTHHIHVARDGRLVSAVTGGGSAGNWAKLRSTQSSRHLVRQQPYTADRELFVGPSRRTYGAVANTLPVSPTPSSSTASSSKHLDAPGSLFDTPDADSSDADESEMTEDVDITPRKAQRTSKASAVAGGIGNRPGDQRARNRVAATKCRAKSKAAVNQLEDDERTVSTRHSHLSAEKAALMDEVLGLRMELLRHSQCDQSNEDIQNYLRNAAHLIGKSGGTAAIWGPDGSGMSNGIGHPDGGGY